MSQVLVCDGCGERILGVKPWILASFEISVNGQEPSVGHEIDVHGWACLLKYWDREETRLTIEQDGLPEGEKHWELPA